jgi:hypothetical protein
MTVGTETKILLTILFLLSFFAFMINLPDFPSNLKFINAFDFYWFGGGTLGVAGACAVLTGLPCAAALAIFGVLSFLKYVVVSYEWLKVLFFMPMIIIIIYIESRLARGGG